MKMPIRYYSILAVFCASVCIIGIAGATGQAWSSAGGAHTAVLSPAKFDLTNVTLQQELIARYQQQGTDVTGLQAAFQSGNMTAVREWMAEHHPAWTQRTATGQTPAKSDLTNETLQQKIIARYQQQGTDVTGLQTAFQSGNMTTVREWMAAHRPAMTPGTVNGQTPAKSDLTNETLQQAIIARYQQQGTDVTGLQAAFQSGNVTAVKEWMAAHRPAWASESSTGTFRDTLTHGQNSHARDQSGTNRTALHPWHPGYAKQGTSSP